MAPRAGQHFCELLRLTSFVLLHLTTYAANLLVIWVFFKTGHRKYLALVVPVHLIVGGLCAYTAVIHVIGWEATRCAGKGIAQKLLMPVKLALAVVVLGFMQLVQVKLAMDDYAQQRKSGSFDDEPLQVPGAMPTRFYCKATDGILESTVFAFVTLYVLLKYKMFEKDFPHGDFDEWHWLLFYGTVTLNFLSTGFALVEVDHRTSLAVQRVLKNRRLLSIRHLLFRLSEVALRLITVSFFCSYLRLLQKSWVEVLLPVGADYLFGVMLLVCLGGMESKRPAPVLLGVPLFIANVMQFVDIPGMSLPARRISKVIVLFRTAELVAMLSFISFDTHVLTLETPHGEIIRKDVVEYFVYDRTAWFVVWISSGVLYYILLVGYARLVRPDADLHSSIAYGDFDGLKHLLCESELVLDVNRYGPEGRTPLHLAALQGRCDCVKLLLQERASINVRTGDRNRDTALHLAVRSRDPAVVVELLQDTNDDSFVNAANSNGDTALHVAARRHNQPAIEMLLASPHVNIKLTNASGRTPADCVPSERFGFDWTSTENVINEIFRSVERRARPHTRNDSGSTSTPVSMELPTVFTPSTSRSSTVAEGNNGGDSPGSESRKLVLVTSMTKEQEAEFIKRSASRASAFPMTLQSSGDTSPSSRQDISSIMMSAGMGTISRAFLNSINEEDDDVQNPSVTADFDDFVEERKIGQGSFGKVSLVRHKDTGERYAMKLMDKREFKAQRIAAKADSEQFILKTTKHRFIVGLFYAFQASNFWVLIMEYCPHGNLQDVLVRHGNPGLAVKDAARLGGEVLLALEHLHGIRVLFRDLKIENVVIDAEYRAQLTDFGLAKKLYVNTDAQTLCGSYGYAAPEIMSSTNRYTYAVDLYSYGVVLYMLLCGGDTPKNKPNQRIPPMKHNKLRRELREHESDPPGEWATTAACAIPLLYDLTSECVPDRGTCTTIKEREFFRKHLANGVDALLTDPGPFTPLSGKPQGT